MFDWCCGPAHFTFGFLNFVFTLSNFAFCLAQLEVDMVSCQLVSLTGIWQSYQGFIYMQFVLGLLNLQLDCPVWVCSLLSLHLAGLVSNFYLFTF